MRTLFWGVLLGANAWTASTSFFAGDYGWAAASAALCLYCMWEFSRVETRA